MHRLPQSCIVGAARPSNGWRALPTLLQALCVANLAWLNLMQALRVANLAWLNLMQALRGGCVPA